MHKKFTLYDCVILEFPKIHNRAGNITPITSSIHIPFEISRVYYLYDVPGGSVRGGHAHKDTHELLVAAGGSFDVLLDDGINRKIVYLNRPCYGLYIVPGIWRELMNFSSSAICLVLASDKYDEKDYIREYTDFKDFKIV